MITALHRILLLGLAVVAGLTLTHVLQSVGSRRLTGPQWLAVQHTFYGGFAIIGGTAEIVSLIAGVILTVCSRHQARAAIPAAVAALAMVGCLLAFLVGNLPVNRSVAAWTPSNLPADWSTARSTWETAHMISAALSLIALVTLIWSSAPTHPSRSEVPRLPAR